MIWSGEEAVVEKTSRAPVLSRGAPPLSMQGENEV